MILATTTIEDFDRFKSIFSTKGLEKRKEHGSKGATVFRDPNQDDRVWVLFDWDADGLAELRLGPRGPTDHERSRAQRSAPGGGARRPIRRLARLEIGGNVMAATALGRPIKVGVIADQTGPLDVHGHRGRQRRQDGDRRDQRRRRALGAADRAAPHRQRDDGRSRGSLRHQARSGGGRCDPRWHLQLDAAGHQGPGCRGRQDALHLPRAVRGTGVRPADLLHRPGAGAAGRSPHPVADGARRARRSSPCRQPTTSGRAS